MAKTGTSPVGANMKSARTAAGMTQEALGQSLSKPVTREAVSQWESGETEPGIARLAEIADILGTTIDGLLGKAAPETRGSSKGREPGGGAEVPLLAVERAPNGWPFVTLGARLGPAPRAARVPTCPGVFAIYSPAEFLSPWRQPGELIFFDRNRPARRGDHVLVELVGGTAIIGELVEHDAQTGAVRLRWYRPETTHKVDGGRVARIVRAIEWSELIAVA